MTSPKPLPPFHPVLFGIFPVVGLFSTCWDMFYPVVLVRPLLASILVTLLGWWICGYVSRDRREAALLTSMIILLGVAIKALPSWMLALLLAFAALYLWVKTARDLSAATYLANIVGAALVIVSAAQCLKGLKQPRFRPRLSTAAPALSPGAARPDIFYIVLDGFGRADVLQRYYQLDQRPFLEALEKRGFYVAARSRSNYVQTHLSVPSTLNFRYWDELLPDANPDPDRRLGIDALRHNELARLLKSQGYRTIAFPTGFDPSEMRTADSFVFNPYSVNEFEAVVLDLTLIPGLFRIVAMEPRLHLHRLRMLQVFRELEDVEAGDAPVFVFAHLLSNHPPFVLGENGEAYFPDSTFSNEDGNRFWSRPGHSRQGYIENYRRQARFVNRRVIEVLDRILANPARPRVVIVQGDHGPGSRWDTESLAATCLDERVSILNAYYFPDRDYRRLYPEISPVNSFRVVLNQYFGAAYDLLPDRSFYSSGSKDFEFTDVTARAGSPADTACAP